MRRVSCTALASLVVAVGAAPTASAGVVPALTLDGPAPEILSLGGLALGEDGSGGVVYLRRAGGAAHVFAVLIRNGSFSSPVQVDAGVQAPAAEPVIAAAAGGRAAIAWVSGGMLFGAVHAAGAARFGAAQSIAPASNAPALAMGRSGTAYASYTVANGGGSDVGVARLDRASTTFVALAGALNASPAGMAGSGPLLRSRVAVAADAIGIVTWGERATDGHSQVFARRVFGLAASSVTVDISADQIAGHRTYSADSPAAGMPDDSSYPWIAFRATVDNGGPQVARVVVRQLIGSEAQPAAFVDGLGFPAGDEAGWPRLAVAGGGQGLVAAGLSGSNQVVGAGGAGVAFGGGQRLNLGNATAPARPAVALGRNGQGIVAFVPDAGSVQARLFDGAVAGEQVPLSRPGFGPVELTGGVSAGADTHGDRLAAFVQGSRLAIGAVVRPPGRFGGITSTRPLPTGRLVLRWTAAIDYWSRPTYAVFVDGRQVGRTTATHLAVQLAGGAHHWRVVATDSLGQQTATAERTLRLGGGHGSPTTQKKPKRKKR